MPCLVLVGHSMGGAIAVRAAHLPSLEPYIQGLAVIDVVEGNYLYLCVLGTTCKLRTICEHQGRVKPCLGYDWVL